RAADRAGGALKASKLIVLPYKGARPLRFGDEEARSGLARRRPRERFDGRVSACAGSVIGVSVAGADVSSSSHRLAYWQEKCNQKFITRGQTTKRTRRWPGPRPATDRHRHSSISAAAAALDPSGREGPPVDLGRSHPNAGSSAAKR